MEVLERATPTQTSELIKKTITKVSTELSKLGTTSSIDSYQILNIYMDLLKLLNNFPDVAFENIKYWTSLMMFTSLQQQNNKQDVLMCVVSLILLQSLLNPSTFGPMAKELLDKATIDRLFLFLTGIAPQLEEEYCNYHVPMNINHIDNFIQLIKDIPQNPLVTICCYKFLKLVINDFRVIVMAANQLTALDTSLMYVNSPLKSQLLEALETVVDFLVNEDTRDLTVIVIVRTDTLEVIQTILSKLLSDPINVYCKLINNFVIDRFSFNYYDSIILSNKHLRGTFESNTMVLHNSEPNQNMQIALQFMLESANHPDSFENKMNLIYLLWSFNELFGYAQLPHGRSNIYTNYNKVYPKVSLVGLIMALGFRLEKQIIITNGLSTPKQLEDALNDMLLPPLPKSDYLLDQFENALPIEPSIFETDNLLAPNVIKCLKFMSFFIKDDIDTSILDSEELDFKVSLHKINKAFDFLFISGYVLLAELDHFCKQTGIYYIQEITKGLLDISLAQGANDSRLVWTCFLEKANSYTISDLRFLPLFQQLFAAILKKYKDDAILKDALIKDEINRYFSTFALDIDKYPQILEYTGIRNFEDSFVKIPKHEAKIDIDRTHQSLIPDDLATSVSNMSLDRVTSQQSLGYSSHSKSSMQGNLAGVQNQPQYPSLKQPQPTLGYKLLRLGHQSFYKSSNSHSSK